MRFAYAMIAFAAFANGIAIKEDEDINLPEIENEGEGYVECDSDADVGNKQKTQAMLNLAAQGHKFKTAQTASGGN